MSSPRSDSPNDVVVLPSHRMVPAWQLAGPALFDATGRRIGVVQDVVAHRATGSLAYGLVALAGAEHGDLTPVPWSLLRFDTPRNGYVVALSTDVLRDAPTTSLGEATHSDMLWRDRVFNHFGVSPIWGE